MKLSDIYDGSKGLEYTVLKQGDPFGRGYQIDFEYFLPYLTQRDFVLDFGCGNGGILRLIGQHVARADGLEVNLASAAIARDSNAKIYSCLDELPSSPIYDAITSNHVLEHARDVCATLERLRRCLKPYGRVVIKLPI